MKAPKFLIMLIIFLIIFLSGCASTTKTPTDNAVCNIDGGCGGESSANDSNLAEIPVSEAPSNIKENFNA